MLMKFEGLKDKNIVVTQTRSELGYGKDQQQTLVGLGLNGVNSKSELKCDKSIYGMLNKVKHVIDVVIK